ncbi:MAG TPA: hypothetical protein VFW12_10695 [Candidatus Limnocylindria bacterium]|nr:hypothetical protein [Candidatus Limnocylindria bacterium]
MSGIAQAVNLLLAVLLWLLVMRLLILNWMRGGATVALFIAFIVLLLAYDLVIAGISVVLMLLFVPTLARSPLGSSLMRLLRATTDPAIELVRRGTGGRVDGGPAMLIAALLVLALRVASYLVLS